MAKRKHQRKSGNHSHIYTIKNGYYLNWQCLGQVYRKAFSIGKREGQYKSGPHALAAAQAFAADLESKRERITKLLAKELAKEAKAKERAAERAVRRASAQASEATSAAEASS